MSASTDGPVRRCIESRWSAGLLAAMAAALALALALPAAAAAGDLYVDDDAICGGNSPCHSTIQAAIDAATGGDTIHVYPGTYNQDEANGRDPDTGGAGSNDFNIFVNKALTIQGVDGSGTPITSNAGVLANVVAKRELPTFGQSTFFVQADDVTITGLEITGWSGTENNKTVEAVGDNFTLEYSEVHGMDSAAAVYMDDRHYDAGTDTSHVQTYRLEGNLLDGGGTWADGIRISNGAGWTGPVSGRVITGNTFTNCIDGIAFVGPGADPWDNYPVGAATITGNTFASNDRRHVIAWGTYGSGLGYGTIDWNGILSSNTFDKAVTVWTPASALRTWNCVLCGSVGDITNIAGIYTAIQRYPINRVAQAGDTINVASGTYTEQVRVSKSLSLVGAGAATTTIDAPPKASRVTENANHGFGLRTYDYLVGVFGTGVETVNISGFTLDGNNDAKSSGAPVPPATAFRSQQLTFFNSNGTIEDNTLVAWQDPLAFGAQGVATLVSGSSTPVTVNVRTNVVSGYQKTGIVAFGSGAVVTTIEGNTVTGAGAIASTAQNGIQMSNGAVGSIVSNQATGNHYTGPGWCASGILLMSDGVTVQGNTLNGSLCDLMIMSNGSTIRGNVIDPALDYPFSVLGNNNIVEMNVVNGSPGVGVYNDGTGNAYTCNRITNNNGGFYFDNYSSVGTPNTVNDNSVFDNGVGVDASAVGAPPNIDATDNWWGCPTGPGNPGCDTVTANVDASLPAAAPPACVSCNSDADCDDTLACNGSETCNTGTNMCEAGTPVVCSDQCETGTCLEPTGTCEPKPNGTTCSLAPACSVPDTCQSGACTLGAGGEDGDSDTVCDADDNCPAVANSGQEDLDGDDIGNVCDNSDGELNVTQAKLRRASSASHANGSVKLKGDFYAPAPDSFSATSGITIEAADDLGFTISHTWASSECVTSGTGRVTCKSADKNFQGKFGPFTATPNVFRFNVTFKKQAIDSTRVFLGPVTVRLIYNGAPVAGIDRVGVIKDCKAIGSGLTCRNF